MCCKYSQYLIKLLSQSDLDIISQYLDIKNDTFSVRNRHFTVRSSNGLSFRSIDVFVNNDGMVSIFDIEK